MNRALLGALVIAALSSGWQVTTAAEKNTDQFLQRSITSAPWLAQRIELFQHRINLEKPPQQIRDALLRQCLGSAAEALTAASEGASALQSQADASGLTGEFDPFVRVSTANSVCQNPNFAINTVSNCILMVWQDERSGSTNPDIYGQLFDLTFNATGTNLKISPDDIPSAQVAPDVCPLSDGRFAVCWEDYSTAAARILVQLVRQDGSLQGNPVVVAPVAAAPQFFPAISAYNDSIYVTWLQQDGGDYNIYIRTLNLAGVPQAPAAQVNDDTGALQWAPDIATMGSGQTVIVWEDKRDGNSEIYLQLYKVDGVKRGDNNLANLDPVASLQWRPAAAAGTSSFQLVWEDYQNSSATIYTQMFDRYGLPVDGNLRVDQPEVLAAREKPQMSFDEQGQRVIAWQEKGADLWRLKFALYPVDSVTPIYYSLGDAYPGREFTEVRLRQAKNTLLFGFLGQQTGTAATLLRHKVVFATVPVELTYFQGTVRDDGVFLVWRTASETSNLGFQIQRKREGEEYVEAGFVAGKGTTSSGERYSFIDRDLAPGKYYYRLRQIDLDGSIHSSEEIEVTVSSPARFELVTAWPNPFQGSTHITLRVPETAMVSVSVYNLLGQRIRKVAVQVFQSGQHQMVWDGLDDQGQRQPAGLYIVQAETQGRIERLKVGIVR